MIASSVGVFAETGNDRAIGFASYLFTRGESGWSTTALEPPVAEYPEAAFEGKLCRRKCGTDGDHAQFDEQ